MTAKDRLENIVNIVDEHGFLSVNDLSRLLNVSEMTIRRDLSRLDELKRIQRTYGGAASLRTYSPPSLVGETLDDVQMIAKQEGFLVDRVDVMIATSVTPKYDRILLERLEKENVPIIAESLGMQNEETVVAVDNYQAGLELGRWAGNYANQHWGGNAYLLDLTYHLTNTQTRSRGFHDGLNSTANNPEIVLSINAQSRYDTAYQLTKDALTVHPQVNTIFAINDTMARGAIDACRDLNIDPNNIVVIDFGLEGDSLRNALLAGEYCKAGLAMFPEIVGPACVEAAIAAYNHQSLPLYLITPFIILTPESITDIYTKKPDGWQLCWDAVINKLTIPIEINPDRPRPGQQLPRRIGFVVPFSEHEWYKNLISSMQAHARHLKIEFEIVDAEQSLRDEVDYRRRQIAKIASDLVQNGDVILIDGGPISNYLAETLANKEDITVITNSMPVFDILRANPEVTLISIGGAYRRSSQMLVGPTAEAALRELRADKLFLTVTGITLNFGLSHTNFAEVTLKQAMIRSAREVILLADHTYFGHESAFQVAPLTVVNKLVTDDAMPASTRLDLTKMQIQILLANM